MIGTETIIAKESLASVWREIQPLLFEHWREVAIHADIPLTPDRALYEQADKDGKLCIITARVDRALVGYAVYFVSPNPHYRQSLQAIQDIFFVQPSLRGAFIGTRLIKESDIILKAMGVQLVFHHVKLKHPILGRLLQRRGYHQTEWIYSKRLD